MKRYEKYKPSGVEWIGEVPEGWEVCRLKNYCSLKGRIGWNGLRSDEFKDVSYAYLVTGQDFDGDVIPWDRCYQIDKERYDEDPFIQLKNGDLLITKDGTIGKIAKVSNLNKPACLNSGIFVMKQTKNKFSQDYLYWQLKSSLLQDFNDFTSSGTTILHLYQNVFENMPMLVPPLSEQTAIAAYLDAKCAKIDNVVAVQQKRIELLKELKQSIITHAVTRGLDKKAKMKDSGVEWIGEVPEEWEVCRLKFYANIIMGQSPDGKDITDDGETPFMQGNAEFTEKYPNPIYYCETCNKHSRIGDVLMSVRAPVGELNLSDKIYGIGRGLCSIKAEQELSTSFLWYYLLKSKKDFNSFANGSTFTAITVDDLKNFPFILPPHPEQNAIATYLDKKCAIIDRQIAKVEKQIELLKEYKQSVITECVTGKRKVC